VVRKKPRARSHIVGSERKRRLSVFKRRVFFKAEVAGVGLEVVEVMEWVEWVSEV